MKKIFVTLILAFVSSLAYCQFVCTTGEVMKPMRIVSIENCKHVKIFLDETNVPDNYEVIGYIRVKNKNEVKAMQEAQIMAAKYQCSAVMKTTNPNTITENDNGQQVTVNTAHGKNYRKDLKYKRLEVNPKEKYYYAYREKK